MSIPRPSPPPPPPAGTIPPHPDVDLGSLEPTTYASLSAPPVAPVVSFRVPAPLRSARAAAAAPPLELSGPPGTVFTLPGVPAPVWQWITVHALSIVIAISIAVLFAMGKASEHLLETVYGILIAAQLQPAKVPQAEPLTFSSLPVSVPPLPPVPMPTPPAAPPPVPTMPASPMARRGREA